MPVGIIQPSNRITLTNISVVRYKKGKKRFELACYKNKLLEYRSGIEKNLDDVLQVPTIFLSVQKGATAPKEDLEKSFGKKASTPEGHDEVIKEILSKGEIQVGAKERGELLERIEKEVLEEVAGRLVDPGTKRVYTTGMISKALDMLSKEGGHAPKQDSISERLGKVNLGENGGKVGGKGKINGDISTGGTGTPTTDGEVEGGGGGGRHDKKHKKGDIPMWTGVVTTKSAKSQALDAMRALIAWQPIPVMRARMRLRITCPTSIAKQSPKSKAAAPTEGQGSDTPAEQHGKGTIKDRILGFVEQVESQDTTGEEWEVVGFVEPGAFKGLGEFVAGETKGRGRAEVLDMAVTHEDEA